MEDTVMAKNVGRVCYGCGSSENIVKDTMVDGERFVLCDNCDEETRVMFADFVRFELGGAVKDTAVEADPAVQYVKRTIVIEFDAWGTLSTALGLAEKIIEAARKDEALAQQIDCAFVKSANHV
jgi:hypothetical protein